MVSDQQVIFDKQVLHHCRYSYTNPTGPPPSQKYESNFLYTFLKYHTRVQEQLDVNCLSSAFTVKQYKNPNVKLFSFSRIFASVIDFAKLRRLFMYLTFVSDALL